LELYEPGDGETITEMAYVGGNPVDRYAAMGRVAPGGPLPAHLRPRQPRPRAPGTLVSKLRW